MANIFFKGNKATQAQKIAGPEPQAESRSSRPRLVLLLQDLLFGGTQRQGLELAKRWHPNKFQVEIWLLMAGDDLVPVAQGAGLPLVWLSRRPRVGPGAILNLGRRLYLCPPDILMCLTVVPNIWGRLLGRWAGVPVIVGNCRGGGAPQRQHERWLWPLADSVITNSHNLKAHLTNHYGLPARQVRVIYNGVDLAYFTPPATEITQRRPVVLSVARLVPDKDHATLLKAFRLVRQDHPEAELWLVGDGPEAGNLRRMVTAWRLHDQVRFFPGQLDIRPFLARATVFALSSIFEALPNVILEAMAAGLPVVATRVGGIPEVVTSGITGWLVPPRDPAALAGALACLLADAAAREAFGQAGRQRVSRDFHLAIMLARHEELLEELWQRKKPLGRRRPR